MQFDVRNVLNVLNHIFYDSTTLYEFYACHEKGVTECLTKYLINQIDVLMASTKSFKVQV